MNIANYVRAFSGAIAVTLFSAFAPADAAAQMDTSLRVLVVTAHPDDHAAFAGTIYKITHDLKGKVDLVVITNGEAGYKYSTLAESYYGLELTDPATGRQYLPGIRKREAMAGGAILGIRSYFFFDEPDKAFTLSADSVLSYHWNVPRVQQRLREIFQRDIYQYVLALLPTADTHGAHKAATIEALDVVRQMPAANRPVVLGATDSIKDKSNQASYLQLAGYPVTAVKAASPHFSFDRAHRFGYRDALDYKIIVNWMIAEHKSQGTMQMLMNVGDVENFWFFDLNEAATVDRTRQLFRRINEIPFEKKTY